MTGRRLLLAWAAACAAGTAAAQNVTLAGRLGERALLVVNGTPVTLAPGASAAGVRLLRWAGDDAEVELEASGQRLLVRVGTPAQVAAEAAPPPGRDIVIAMGQGGHFTPSGAINGRAVRFMVDTGATMVALGQDEAQRLGLDLSNAQTGMTHTANGPVQVRMLVLDRVRVGGVEIRNVGAVVVPQPMPYVLLGNSFLNRFQMRRENDVMRLQLRP